MAEETMVGGQKNTEGGTTAETAGTAESGGEQTPSQEQQAGQQAEAGGGEQSPESQAQGGQGEGGEAGAEASGETAGDQGDEGGEDGDQGPPEQYDFSQALPEGMELDQTAVDEIAPVFRELGLTQEQADKVVGVHAQKIQAMQQQAQEQHQQQVEQWAQQVREDPEIGGDALDENLATARKVLDTFDVPDDEGNGQVSEILNRSGLGNNPAVIKMLKTIGERLSEDQFVSGQGAPGGKDPLKSMYPSMSKE